MTNFVFFSGYVVLIRDVCVIRVFYFVLLEKIPDLLMLL